MSDNMEKNHTADIFRKGKDFLDLFQKGKEFTEELLKENERLRVEILKLEKNTQMKESEMSATDESVQETVRELEAKVRELEVKCERVKTENEDFTKRYLEVEEENNKLANLYVASYHLHSSLELHQVIRTIAEIVINLIGADQFVIYIIDNDSDRLVPAFAEGGDIRNIDPIIPGQGKEGEIALATDIYMDPEGAEGNMETRNPVAAIPLAIKDNTIGLISIYRLLDQKSSGLDPIDFELFSLLASHASSALFGARLYTQSKRKLDTMEGLIDLLKDTTT